MTLLAFDPSLDSTNVVRLADRRKALGLPPVPDHMPLTYRYQPGDLVRVVGAQRRAKIVCVERDGQGSDRYRVMFIEGRKDQAWRGSFYAFQLSLLKSPGGAPGLAWPGARQLAAHDGAPDPAA